MSANALGSIALGVVGALLAPIGFAAIGWAVGSAIGGMIFAPEGPQVEGPRIGDTAVTSSSMGKVIGHHWGVVRVGGNVIYSAGLKETKTEEEQGGKGGGGATVTSYDYYCSFAVAFGRAPGRTLRRLWADGKLIYDSGTATRKHPFQFVRGGTGSTVHPIMAESINRRLAGMDDINAGNQEQENHTTFDDLIAQAQADDTPRGAIYLKKMLERKREAAVNLVFYGDDTGVPPSDDPAYLPEQNSFGSLLSFLKNFAANRPATIEGVPDFRMTPSYEELCYVIFDDMHLKDFGNRIPNITAEIEFDIEIDPEETTVPSTDLVPTVSNGIPTGGLMGVDETARTLLCDTGGDLRRFTTAGYKEDRFTGVTANVERVITTNQNGDMICLGTEDGVRKLLFYTTTSMAPLGGVAWPHLDFAGIANEDLHGVRFPKQEWDANAPTLSQATAFLVATDTDLGLLENGKELQSAVFSSANGVSRSGPFTTPYRQNNQPKVVMVRYGERVIELVKVNISSYTQTVQTGTYQSGRIAGDPIYSQVTYPGLNVQRHEIETPAAIADGPTLSYCAAFFYDHTNLGTNFDAATDKQPWRALFIMSDGTGRIRTSDGEWHEIPTPPRSTSGFGKSSVYGGKLLYGVGTTLVELNVLDGTYIEHADIFTTGANPDNQIYIGDISALLTWDGTRPVLAYVGRTGLGVAGSRSLSGIIDDICRRAGMSPDEFDVSPLDQYVVDGFSVARTSSARQALEMLLTPYRVDGVERDYKITFQNRSNDPVRIIQEDELGPLGDDQSQTNFSESRTPEYELPAEVNLNFPDPARDYETNTVQKRRIAQPVSVMDSLRVQNIEVSVVMSEPAARALAETMLFQQWQGRDRAAAKLNWTHLDLDPADVVQFQFRDGRTLTDRLSKITTGANFEMEIESARAGDPVFTPAPSARIQSATVPTQAITTSVPSEMFIFDIPLLEDFHDAGRNGSRVYMAAGAVGTGWRSAAFYERLAGSPFFTVESTPVDITWGQTTGTVPPPRALWSTDRDTQINVHLSIDKGNIASITKDEMLQGGNRALIYNKATDIGEIIQFQDVEVNDDGSLTLSTLYRGLRGTDYAVEMHSPNAQFFLLTNNAVKSKVNALDRINSSSTFKAVSARQLISEAKPLDHTFKGRDQMPWAPSRVRRSEDVGDLLVSWNRRARLGGVWNTSDTVEITPLSEESEVYEIYLLDTGPNRLENFNPSDPASYLLMETKTFPEARFTAAQLADFGITLEDTINVVIYQRSSIVGRGFPRKASLAP